MMRCPSAHLFAAALAATLTAAPAAAEPAAAAARAGTPGAAATVAAAPGTADGFTWAVQPSSAAGPTGRSYFVYDVTPGQRVDDRVAITNLGDQPMTFTVYGADAFTTDDGSFALQPASRPAVDVGAWATVAVRTHRIPAGGRVIVPFQLTVPANATPGDHAGGIVASVAQARDSRTGQRVRLDRRVAARIYLRVAGPLRPAVQVEAMRIGYDNPLNPFGSGPVVVSYRLRNTGNVRLAGTGQVRIGAPFGWRLAGTAPIDVPELLPGAAITVTEQVNGIVPAGRLGIRVDVRPTSPDGTLPRVTRTASVWAVPWVWTGLLLALAAWLVVRRLRRTRARPPAEPDAAA